MKRTLIVSAALYERFTKLTIPPLAVAVVVPCNVPVPNCLAAVTIVVLSPVSKLPN